MMILNAGSGNKEEIGNWRWWERLSAAKMTLLQRFPFIWAQT